MRSARYLTAIVALLVGLTAAGSVTAEETRASRIVAIGGSVTETVYALGEEKRLVGRDSTSVYPAEAIKLPDTGYIRALSPEGVMSLNPDLVLALEGAGPPDALQTLKSAGVQVAMIPDGYDRAAISRKVKAIGAALGVAEKANALAARLDEALGKAIAASSAETAKARVLFVSLQGGRIMAAGSANHANGMISLAGGENVMASISGYKQVSDEAVIAAAPDVILMMNGTGDHVTTNETILAHPALAATPAGKAGRVVRMDGMYLLGFGPRSADAIVSLHGELYPGQTTGQTTRQKPGHKTE